MILSRFIPTGVGNSFQKFSVEDHTYGSSPREWGTPLFLELEKWWVRFIPTDVGNSP